MHQIKYQIKTLSPILLSTNSGDMNTVATNDYIPGHAILGVFASKYIQDENLSNKAHQNTNFYHWFLNSGIIFSNAYPCKKDEYVTRVFFPIPLSIQTEKDNETLAIDLLQKDSEKQMKMISGYGYIAEATIQRFTPSKSLNLHHARPDRIKGHSTEGRIFNYESIDPDQLFQGVIIGGEDVLKDFIKSILRDKKFSIQLGRSRTAQYGQAELEVLSKSPEELNLEEDLASEFILTLLSPTIIYNKYGFSSTSQDTLKEYLAETLAMTPGQIKIDRSFKRPVEIENFISVWRLKRPSEVAFQAGSCFSIRITNGNNSFIPKLKDLQKNGLGERRGEVCPEIRDT